jgi:hypothetical protein
MLALNWSRMLFSATPEPDGQRWGSPVRWPQFARTPRPNVSPHAYRDLWQPLVGETTWGRALTEAFSRHELVPEPLRPPGGGWTRVRRDAVERGLRLTTLSSAARLARAERRAARKSAPAFSDINEDTRSAGRPGVRVERGVDGYDASLGEAAGVTADAHQSRRHDCRDRQCAARGCRDCCPTRSHRCDAQCRGARFTRQTLFDSSAAPSVVQERRA